MRTIRTAAALAISTIITIPVSAQQKRPLDHDAYAVWNQIDDEALSADGAWLAYRLVPGEGDATLMIEGLREGRTLVVARGGAPRFTADSRFLVALVEPAEAAVDAARDEDEPLPRDSLVVVDLSDLSTFRSARVASFELPEDDARWMAYLLAPEQAEDDDEEAEEEEEEEEPADTARVAPRLRDGTTLVVRDLPSGQERRFEQVLSYEFAADGSVLYYAASGAEGAADGVYRVGREGAAAAMASGAGRYLGLAVSDDGSAAFLTDRDDRASEAPAFALYVATGGGAEARVLPGDPSLPDGWAPSEHGDVSFSASGRRIFFGSARAPVPEPEDDVPDDEAVVLDIWNWKDPYLQPMQLLEVEDERERTYEAMLDLRSGRVMQLATEDMSSVSVAAEGDGTVALGRSDLPYRQLVSWDGRYSDLHVVHLGDGSREQIAEMVRGTASLSPGGRYATWWDGFDERWYAVEAATGRAIDLTGSLPVPFHDVLDDHPDALRSYGAAGWTEGDETFVVYDQFDVWAIDPTGQRAARNLTEGVGRRTGTRFRYVDLGDERWVPTDQDVYLTAFQLDTKQNGVYRDRFGGSGEPQRLLMADARFDDLLKAEDADVVVYSRSTFQEFPDLWVADDELEGARKVTDANPQQDQYAWGTAELVEWSSNDGIPLKGILYKPDGFDASRQYPMMVYFYERLSDGLHQYVVPAAGSSSINRSFYVSRGYLLFVPDIPYRIGYPGESALDAVVPGVLHLVDQGFVDRDRIGVQGHSWGGYQIAYMVTRTDLFAAAEAGAPVANMVSAYGGIRWGSGMSRMFQYERTQSRIGGSLWEKPLRYIENSPIFTADKIRTPILMMHNDEDTAVPWYQGIELFVALRRLGQPVWMLNYNGELHGLTKEQNRKDWAVRMQQFFDHYLKDAPAPVWMEEGVPATMKGRTLGLELVAPGPVSEEGVSGR